MMNILIVSNNDACRSRMAMEILTFFWKRNESLYGRSVAGNGILILFSV